MIKPVWNIYLHDYSTPVSNWFGTYIPSHHTDKLVHTDRQMDRHMDGWSDTGNANSPLRVPPVSCESKLRTFQGPFQDHTRCFKDLYGKFYNADMIFALLMKISNDNDPSMQAAYKANPIVSNNQTFFYQPPPPPPPPPPNKDFSWTFLQKLLKLSTFPIPKDPFSKVGTFSGNKDL